PWAVGHWALDGSHSGRPATPPPGSGCRRHANPANPAALDGDPLRRRGLRGARARGGACTRASVPRWRVGRRSLRPERRLASSALALSRRGRGANRRPTLIPPGSPEPSTGWKVARPAAATGVAERRGIVAPPGGSHQSPSRTREHRFPATG